MKKAIAKFIFLLAALIASLSAALFIPDVSTRNTLVYGFSDKLHHLNTKENIRLVFVGGSSSYFGVSAEILDTLYGRAAYNMGTHAGVGLKFMLEKTLPTLSLGDTIVIVPEYEQFNSSHPVWYGEGELFSLLAHNPQNTKTLNYRQVLRMTRKYIDHTSKRWVNYIYYVIRLKKYSNSGVYSRSAITRYGDVDPSYTKQYFSHDTEMYLDDPDKDVIKAFHDIIDSLRNQGAQVFFFPPPLPRSLYFRNRTLINTYWDLISSNGYALTDPENVALEEKLFFDTKYHLNNSGRRLYTQLLNDKLNISSVDK